MRQNVVDRTDVSGAPDIALKGPRQPSLGRLVLQRLFSFSTAPPQFFATSCLVTLLCHAISLHSSVAPRGNFVYVPLPQIEEATKNRANFRDRHLFLFLLPFTASGRDGYVFPGPGP